MSLWEIIRKLLTGEGNSVYYIGGRNAPATVHTHIQRRISAD